MCPAWSPPSHCALPRPRGAGDTAAPLGHAGEQAQSWLPLLPCCQACEPHAAPGEGGWLLCTLHAVCLSGSHGIPGEGCVRVSPLLRQPRTLLPRVTVYRGDRSGVTTVTTAKGIVTLDYSVLWGLRWCHHDYDSQGHCHPRLQCTVETTVVSPRLRQPRALLPRVTVFRGGHDGVTIVTAFQGIVTSNYSLQCCGDCPWHSPSLPALGLSFALGPTPHCSACSPCRLQRPQCPCYK
ncbi:hypothetical protein KIL84_010760 [Mauremys mutica]|uniref:Uncharacterized protein n=1 Tax=Mauremys mutica TaxID=74926 RepID=A0A9D4B0C9_9SAUR|nr:hypothetical protein KIL84_010760 [Mauremys mutica]